MSETNSPEPGTDWLAQVTAGEILAVESYSAALVLGSAPPAPGGGVLINLEGVDDEGDRAGVVVLLPIEVAKHLAGTLADFSAVEPTEATRSAREIQEDHGGAFRGTIIEVRDRGTYWGITYQLDDSQDQAIVSLDKADPPEGRPQTGDRITVEYDEGGNRHVTYRAINGKADPL